MATVTTQTYPTIQQFGFTGLTDPQRARSQVPRQEIFCSLQNDPIAAPGAGNDRIHEIRIELPNNFAHVLVEAHCFIDTATGNAAWAKDALGAWKNGQANPDVVIPLSMTSPSTQAENAPANRILWNLNQVPNMVLVPVAMETTEFLVRFADPTTNGAASTCTFFARFLMYDIDQAHHWEVNTPTLMR